MGKQAWLSKGSVRAGTVDIKLQAKGRCQKHQEGGGYLKIAVKGREALTLPKIWVKYVYPPKKGHNTPDPP